MIELKEFDNYATIRIMREEKANAMNLDLIDEISAAVDSIEKKKNIISVIITGSGKFFSAGGDLSEMLKLDESSGRIFSLKGQKLMDNIEGSEKIYIAALNGPAYGGGMELALACDIRIASRDVKMGQTEINVGLVTGWGGAERLIKYVGKSIASYLLLTGAVLDAESAYKFGIIHKISDNPFDDAVKISQDLSKKNPDALRAYKHMLNIISFDLESIYFGKIVSSQNGKEAINAFFEKRVPNFK
jgi:enoyl-CoA hydratase/carnithine racemase